MTQGNGGTTSRESKRTLSDQELDRMVDAYFDRELSIGERRRLFDQLSGKGGRCEDIARMQRILAQLRQPPDEIDVADEVIAQVGHRRSFLSPTMRSAIRVGRVAVAASVLLTLLGIVIVQRIAPDATSLVAETTPVTSLMQNTGFELSQIRSNLAGVQERAAHVLQPQMSRISNGADRPVEVTVGVAALVAQAPRPSPFLPAMEHHQLVVLSGAGDALLGEIWNINDASRDVPQGSRLDSGLVRSQGFRTVERRVVTRDLSARIDGKRSRVVPYYVEHFQAGALPVAFDTNEFSGILRLISRASEAPVTPLDPDR